MNSIIVCVCVKSHSRVKADSRSGRRSINLITNHKNVIVWEIRTCARDYLLLVLHAVLFVDPARYLSAFDDDDVTERRAIFPDMVARPTDLSAFSRRATRERDDTSDLSSPRLGFIRVARRGMQMLQGDAICSDHSDSQISHRRYLIDCSNFHTHSSLSNLFTGVICQQSTFVTNVIKRKFET